MKQRFTVIRKHEESFEVEVDLPMYRQHSHSGEYPGGTTWYYRVDSPEREVCIAEKEDERGCMSYELATERACSNSGEEWTLCTGKYASSRAQFDGAVKRMRAWIRAHIGESDY